MLFNENLAEIIFNRHELFDCDELIILSGYLGPSPVGRLIEIPIQTTVIYGMYGSDGIQNVLHQRLINSQNLLLNTNIFYSNVPVHSKAYVWKLRGQIVHALVGSANFSTNGLTTPFREIIAETTRDTFQPLNSYIDRVLANCISCLEHNIITDNLNSNLFGQSDCRLTLLDNYGNVPDSSGLNWGQNPRNHVRPNDAYIKVRVEDIRSFPGLFPPKQLLPVRLDGRGRRANRHNDAIEILWDDGITMEGLFEQTQTINDVVYPKAISSFPVKSELGEYIRNRIGVPLGQPVRKHHLDTYGRTDISVSLINEGIYKFDFSV